MAGIPRGKRALVLDLWSKGFTGREIAAKVGAGTPLDVSAILRTARRDGAPRAAAHSRADNDTQTVDTNEFFSREQYRRMDLAFKARLMRAIRRNKEHVTIGVLKSRMPTRAVPLRIQPEPWISITGSSAGECADIGAATASS
jgi:hypothetical protein